MYQSNHSSFSYVEQAKAALHFCACNIPKDYETAVRLFADEISKKGQLPVEDEMGSVMYPVNSEWIYNRICYQISCCMSCGEMCQPTVNGIREWYAKFYEYGILLNQEEERAFIKIWQAAREDSSTSSMEKDDLFLMAVTALGLRIVNIYKEYREHIWCPHLNMDFTQLLMIQLIHMLDHFDLEMTSAGLVENYFRLNLKNAFSRILLEGREVLIARSTWRKAVKCAKEEDIENMTQKEMMEKYHLAKSTVNLVYLVNTSQPLVQSLERGKSKSESHATDGVMGYTTILNRDIGRLELELSLKQSLTPLEYRIVCLKVAGYRELEISEKVKLSRRKLKERCRIIRRKVSARFDFARYREVS